MKVNFVDLQQQYKKFLPKVADEIGHMMAAGHFVGGKALEEFEAVFQSFHSVPYAVGVGSGTDALWLSLKALGIGPGDEVMVPTNTFIATAFAVTHCGAKVKFVDVDPETYVITPQIIKDNLTRKTKAVIPVHLYGQPCDMPDIMRVAKNFQLAVVEDCAQAIGALVGDVKVGTFGHTGCFSFYPTKNLGGLAQGGAVITKSRKIAQEIRSIGNVGRVEGSWFDYGYLGMNSRLDSINACFLKNIITGDWLKNWTLDRLGNAMFYNSLLRDVEEVKTPVGFRGDGKIPVFHLYELKCEDRETRDSLKEYLTEREIGTGLHYPVPCHKQPVYDTDDVLPVSEDLCDTLLSLPMHPHLTEEQITYVCDCIKEFFRGD